MSLTKQYVEEKAEALAAAEMVANSMAMGNAYGQTPAEAVKAQAQMHIVRDRARAARDDYNRAFEDWRKAGFPD